MTIPEFTGDTSKPYTAARLRRTLLAMLVMWNLTVILPTLLDVMAISFSWLLTGIYVLASLIAVSTRHWQLRAYRAEGRPLP